jgi:predicted ATPase/class 3 adenylate cyclase/Tfp pilus assembly protein PilF
MKQSVNSHPPDKIALPISLPLPTGTLTFLFTDIEGSTRLWDRFPDEMRAALRRHDNLIETCVAEHAGVLVRPRGEGDSRFAVFTRASDAVAAAGIIQRRLADETWTVPSPLRVRIALHTGEADLRDGDYYGSAVNRCARLRSAAHGGQTLLSQATRDLVLDALPPGYSLLDMGEHRLKDLRAQEHIFQLVLPGLPVEFPPLAGLGKSRTNLTPLLSTFVGREQEMVELKDKLAQARLVTITGTGGAGKTRLAVQVAAETLDTYPDGVWFVELAPLSDPALVPQLVANALRVREQEGQSLTQTLLDYLHAKQLLLVLDNCEHLIQVVAELVDKMMRSAPALCVLATSREPLGTAGELVWGIPPLSFPKLGAELNVDHLTQYDAIRLFVDRAGAANPGFAVTVQNAPAVARICTSLDGAPLAIELAAARVRVLSVEEIAARLDDRFHLLASGTRTATPRQQNLRALINWSYDLLSDTERILFRRLAIFAGGWTLESAEAVCSGRASEDCSCELEAFDILDLLSHLVDKSLVVAEPQDGVERFRFLETIRQYSRERMIESGEAECLAERHAGYFCHMAEGCYRKLWGPEQGRWLARLDAENENLRAALEWAAQDTARAEILLRLAGSLWRFWEVRTYYSEGRAWLERAVAANPNARPYLRANALRGAGALARPKGDYAQAQAFHEQSLALFRECNYQPGVGRELDELGEIAGYLGDYARAEELQTASLELRRAIGDSQGVAHVLIHLADLASDRGNYPQAKAMLEESLERIRKLGDKLSTGLALNDLGAVLLLQGEHVRAVPLFEEALALYRELNDRLGISNSLQHLATAAKDAGNFRRALDLYSECLSLKHELEDRRGIGRTLIYLGEVALLQGDYARTMAFGETSLALATGLGIKRFMMGALILQAFAASYQGDHDRSASLCRDILVLRADSVTPNIKGYVHVVLGLNAYALGKLDEAVEELEIAAGTFRNLGDRRNTVYALAHQSRVLLARGDLPRARQQLEECVGIARQACLNWHLALALLGMGLVERRTRNDVAAREALIASLDLSAEQENRQGMAQCLFALASLQVIPRPRRAVPLFAAAGKLRQAMGTMMPVTDRQDYDTSLLILRRQMDDATFQAAWAEGQSLSIEQAIEEAKKGGTS